MKCRKATVHAEHLTALQQTENANSSCLNANAGLEHQATTTLILKRFPVWTLVLIHTNTHVYRSLLILTANLK